MKHRAAVCIAILTGTLVRWRVHLMLPGLLGAALVSAGGGELAGHVFGHGLALWAALALAGAFLLWIGRELNQAPKPTHAPHTEGD